mmetsp:Transcript_2479/g.7599  ORF Transcript_2479/g.7599 Transcript_2479/m.7599 type:complete len:493 (+) Transcript_2479:37-1515(+)
MVEKRGPCRKIARESVQVTSSPAELREALSGFRGAHLCKEDRLRRARLRRERAARARHATRRALLGGSVMDHPLGDRDEFIRTRRELVAGLHQGKGRTDTVEDPRHGKVLVTPHVRMLIEKDRREACPQCTPVWYEKRKNHVTASMMATACRDNPYESRATSLRKKVGLAPPFRGNAATEHGNTYELEAIKMYEERYNTKCLTFGLLESLNPGEEFLAGSPDGITVDGRLIEVKCPFYRTPTEVVPHYYVYQVQFLMHTLQLPDCDFIQYVPWKIYQPEIFIVTRIEYDPGFWYKHYPALRSFWDDVLRVRAAKIEHRDRLMAEGKPESEAREAANEEGDRLVSEICGGPRRLNRGSGRTYSVPAARREPPAEAADCEVEEDDSEAEEASDPARGPSASLLAAAAAAGFLCPEPTESQPDVAATVVVAAAASVATVVAPLLDSGQEAQTGGAEEEAEMEDAFGPFDSAAGAADNADGADAEGGEPPGGWSLW